ncbi:unnamed protein product [Camellia sinensis]
MKELKHNSYTLVTYHSKNLFRMNSENSFTAITPPVFDGTNYQVWAVRMEAYLDANDLWEAAEQVYEVPPLPDNPTLAQIKNQKEMKQRKSKARATLFAAVSSTIFTRIMTLKTTKEIWDFLKQEYEGNARIKGMQVLNLIREFEMQKMKKLETIKEYSERLFGIVNKVRLLGTDFSNSRIVQKNLVIIPEKFEATISSLENSKDMSSITLAELLNTLQAQEQRRLLRQKRSVEGAFQAKSHNNNGVKNKKGRTKTTNLEVMQAITKITKVATLKSYHFAPTAKKTIMHRISVSGIQMQDVTSEKPRLQRINLKRSSCFLASCFATNSSIESWLINSGCTNHMTYNRELFKELEKIVISKVRIGNGVHIAVKGKGTVAIEGHMGLKLISDVLYVPEINQNLLSVTQLLEKGYKVLFEDKNYVIKDSKGIEVFKVQMKGKSFALDLMKDEQAVVHKEDSNIVLWHKRLGHFHHATLLFMKKNNLVKGLPELEELQLIHTDVRGPMKTPSSNGTPYNPQQNGVVERKNWTIMEMTSADVQFLELDNWSWENDKKLEIQKENDDVDDEPIRGTISLSDIYQRCNVSVMEPTGWMLLALAAQKGWVIHQMDVKLAFLNGYLEKEIFVEQPKGFAFQGQEEKVCQLKKALYGLKQAPRSWYSRIDAHLVNLGYEKRSSKELIDKFKEEMKDVFEMTDLGRMTFFLGMQKFCKEDGAEKVDERLYRSLIGCLMYLTTTRPDIMHAMSLLSRYMHRASEIHFQARKRILRYVKGIIDYGIRFSQAKNFSLYGYSDSDWVGCVNDMRNTSSYCFTFGSRIFSWCSKKQAVIVQSTAEAEYVAAAAAVNQSLCIKKLMIDLHMEQQEGTQIFVDNQAAISIANNPVFHGKTKHFKIKFYLLREVQREGEVQLIYCKTENQSADILTKALPNIRYEFLR